MGTLRKMGAFLGLVPDDHQRYDGGQHDGEYDQPDAGHADYAGYSDAGYSDAGYSDAGYSGGAHEGASHDGAFRDDASSRGATYGDPAHDGTTRGATPYEVADSRHDRSASEASAGRAADHQTVVHHTTAQRDADHYDGGLQGERDHAPRGGVRRPAFAAAGRTGRSADADQSQDDYRTQGALAVQHEVRVPAVVEPATTQKPATVSLTGFADAREVGEFYRNGQAVILDMTDLTDAEARRMVDFAAGLAFAVHGSIDKVTTKVFMLHPPADSDR